MFSALPIENEKAPDFSEAFNAHRFASVSEGGPDETRTRDPRSDSAIF